MRIATYNVNSIRARLDVILRWLDAYQPDVLCLQETKCQDRDFPILMLAGSGYQAFFRGMKGYNGVAVLTRIEPDLVTYGFSDGQGERDEVRLMRVDVRGVPIINTYVPNGYRLGSAQYAYKLDWFRRLRAYFEEQLSPQQPAVWLGDMNVAPEPIDVHHPERHVRHVCFHVDVRLAYREAVSWGWIDVFRRLYPDRQQFTFWDYLRPSSLDENKGWRIDHVLATAPLADRCRAVEVDLEPRRAPRASDHTFVWADFDL